MRKAHLEHTALVKEEDGWVLHLSYHPGPNSARGYEMLEIRGHDAMRVAGQVLPKINASGASKAQVQDAVRILEEHPDPMDLFQRQARTMRALRTSSGAKRSAAATRALEMPGSVALWPASGTMTRSASGQAFASSQALSMGQTRS